MEDVGEKGGRRRDVNETLERRGGVRTQASAEEVSVRREREDVRNGSTADVFNPDNPGTAKGRQLLCHPSAFYTTRDPVSDLRPGTSSLCADYGTKYLLANGLLVNGKPIEVCLEALVCDVPARSFVIMTKGHSGYNGCPKCCIVGAYIGSKVVFPNSDCPLRTDASFRQQHDSEHHRGTLILDELPLDTVCDVPLD
ncbi:hypothetical protein HPB49_007867 [Dermacentor silvarum]|uniref:Uncharacterized protein n=1 Tax=Dermacentor silvarum TaxID=543639 RepID=A0ACB8C844_DERSI|nr:hypothetical protein HPB49_007867 [Dermacentor silvarum]